MGRGGNASLLKHKLRVNEGFRKAAEVNGSDPGKALVRRHARGGTYATSAPFSHGSSVRPTHPIPACGLTSSL